MRFFVLFGAGFVFFLSANCMAETVSLPLTIDYPLLRSLVVYQAFSEPNETVTILDEKDGCNRVTLSQPTFREENSQVRFECRVHIRLGKPFGENCLMPVEWEGYLVFFQRPQIDFATWRLSFKTTDSKVYDLNRKPATIVQSIVNIISSDTYHYLNSIHIDLAPPLSELKSVFSEFFQPTAHDRSMKILQSIRPGKPQATPQAVEIGILMDVKNHAAKQKKEKKETISDQELERMMDQWKAWDAFLVHIFGILAPEPLTSEERQILLEILLVTRHRFVAGLTDKNLDNDFVREQFIAVWGEIAPVFRKHLSTHPSEALLGYLAFFTASDALSALDKMGPALGIEISRNGLIRLIHLLADQKDNSTVLTDHPGVDGKLREVLGLGPPLPALGPAFDADALDLTDRNENQMNMESIAHAIDSFFCKPAWAKQNQSADALAEIKSWLFYRKDIEPFIDRTRSLLTESARKTLHKRQVPENYKRFFPLVVVSTAWQESCFRQFLVKHKKIVYLRSYNGSSVGLMQINERVWRGIYDPHHLRWDIRYNVLAGCEIIDLYVTKYLLNNRRYVKTMQKMKDETRAGIIYAMYNGGPGQFEKFLSRSAKGQFYDSDKLFLEKYIWVKKGQLGNVSQCLIGQ